MSKHLARRGGVWWARLVVPARLREATGRREFIQSCKTHELHIAKLVAAVLVAGWRRQLLELESVAMNSDVLKLIDKAPALTVGGYMSIAEAAASIGVERNWLLRIASTYSLKLHCRLVNTPGHILAGAELQPAPGNQPQAGNEGHECDRDARWTAKAVSRVVGSTSAS